MYLLETVAMMSIIDSTKINPLINQKSSIKRISRDSKGLMIRQSPIMIAPKKNPQFFQNGNFSTFVQDRIPSAPLIPVKIRDTWKSCAASPMNGSTRDNTLYVHSVLSICIFSPPLRFVLTCLPPFRGSETLVLFQYTTKC